MLLKKNFIVAFVRIAITIPILSWAFKMHSNNHAKNIMVFKEPKEITTALAQGPWTTIIWDFSHTLATINLTVLDPSKSVKHPLLHLASYISTIPYTLTSPNNGATYKGRPYPPLLTAWTDGTLTSSQILAMCEAKGFPDEVTQTIARNFFSPNFLARHVYQLEQEFVSFIQSSKKHGCKHFILTNLDEATVEALQKVYPQTFALFEGIMVSAKEHLIKPDLAFFKRLLATYSLDAKNCIFIDDEEINCHAANHVGMQSIHFAC